MWAVGGRLERETGNTFKRNTHEGVSLQRLVLSHIVSANNLYSRHRVYNLSSSNLATTGNSSESAPWTMLVPVAQSDRLLAWCCKTALVLWKPTFSRKEAQQARGRLIKLLWNCLNQAELLNDKQRLFLLFIALKSHFKDSCVYVLCIWTFAHKYYIATVHYSTVQKYIYIYI